MRDMPLFFKRRFRLKIRRIEECIRKWIEVSQKMPRKIFLHGIIHEKQRESYTAYEDFIRPPSPAQSDDDLKKWENERGRNAGRCASKTVRPAPNAAGCAPDALRHAGDE